MLEGFNKAKTSFEILMDELNKKIAGLRNMMQDMKSEVYAIVNPELVALDEYTKNLYIKVQLLRQKRNVLQRARFSLSGKHHFHQNLMKL